jgi:hypothetical protein
MQHFAVKLGDVGKLIFLGKFQECQAQYKI